jgi:hypothetical protein
MEPYLWIWLLAAPLVFAVLDLTTTGRAKRAH